MNKLAEADTVALVTGTAVEPHKSITEAMNAVMNDVVRLQRTDENKHGKYKYVPIDDVKDFLRPLLVKHGLALSVSESSAPGIKDVPSRNGTTSTMFVSYGIALAHQSQPNDILNNNITIILPYVGAQTAGIARSYAVKEWAKATLLLSTGEEGGEADTAKPEHYGTAKEFDPDRAPVKKAREIFDALLSDMRSFSELDKLDSWWNSQTIAERRRALSASWKKQAFIEFLIYGLALAEDTGAARAFKKSYEDAMKQLSDEDLLTIDDSIADAKAK